ncbi:hypothetical protein [Streptomyces sp. JJ36]|uniref:hypothetical protein n=1 Tax=Streptomyces sp. JJ36 TaxID=2736645 RepID=UPI001F28DA40|nr:hypothetical protein [Streptomyces sp. JJ36]MCF6524036.1 hypothetical protein [Streptomyces sp. JJ36]
MTDPDDARTPDEELRTLDVPLMLRYGLTLGGPHRAALFGDGAVAAALQAEALGVLPRSVSYLGEVVRRGGTRHAAGLPEPLPEAEPSVLADEWLTAAAAVVTPADVDADETLARWLEAVAAVMALRRDTTAG